MGKKNKLNQILSSEISKHDKNKQMNSVIRSLRPKVYITDCMSFKRLVQELTGNGTSSVSSPPESSPENYMIPANPRLEVSVDTACSQEPCNFGQKYVGGSLSCFDHDSTLVSYEDIEAWLLDVSNPGSVWEDHHASLEQVSMFDSEFLGLL